MIALVTDIAYNMRAAMVANSKLDSRNATGKSAGFFGDAFKLGGGRFDVNIASQGEDLYLPDGSINPKFELPFGGFQGGPGKLFGIDYEAGSWQDRLVESYAGPHDWLGSWWSYNGSGNNDYANSVFGHFLGGGGIAKAMDAIMGGVDIAIATPIVAASTLGIFPVTSVPLEKKRHTP